VIPIISKIVGEKGQQPTPPLIADVEQREAVKEGKGGELHRFGYGVDEDIADPHGDIGGRIFDSIEVTPHESIGDYFQSQKDQESWDSKVNKVRHLALFLGRKSRATNWKPPHGACQFLELAQRRCCRMCEETVAYDKTEGWKSVSTS